MNEITSLKKNCYEYEFTRLNKQNINEAQKLIFNRTTIDINGRC